MRYYPSNVLQQSDSPDIEIPWESFVSSNSEFLLSSRWRPTRNLLHIANPATGSIRNRTWSLVCTGFNITDLSEVNGIQLNLSAQRNGRITDEVVQLTYLNQPIGNNNVSYLTDSEGHLTILNDTIYGGSTDLWGADLTPEILQDPSFGVILKFQSHPYYPHSSGMYLNSVSIDVF